MVSDQPSEQSTEKRGRIVLKQFIDLLDTPYSRRGSYMSFANDNNGINVKGKSNLWLCNSRSLGYAMTSMGAQNNYRQVLLQPILNGRPVAAFINNTPYEVILETDWGEIRFCLGEKKMVMIRGEKGLGLRITPPAPRFRGPISLAQPGAEGRRLIEFNMSNLVITPIAGKLKAFPAWLDLTPDENGVIQAAIDDCPIDPELRGVEEFPSYDECVAAVKSEFDSFCEAVMPELPEPYEEKRLQALWQTWNMMVGPDDENDYRRPMVKMIHCIFEQAFAWQMPMQAICMNRDPKLAWDVFCSCFQYQDRHGRLSDAVPYKDVPGRPAMKPPIQGMGLLWLMDHGVIDAAAPSEEDRQWMLQRMIRWTEYYYNFRDSDGDGLCEYYRALETGWEDAPQYQLGYPLASPDLNTFLALQLEAIARFGALCGMPEEERQGYMARSKKLIGQIVERFWDGEGWFAFNTETGQRSDCDNISLYIPMLLGDRLPKEITEKCIAGLFRQGGFDSQCGLTSEALDSRYYRGGFSSGSVITPAQFFFCLALEDLGRRDLAEKVARAYCGALKDHGFYHIYNPLNGCEDRTLTAYGEKGLFWSAWTSSCYFFLADRYGR